MGPSARWVIAGVAFPARSTSDPERNYALEHDQSDDGGVRCLLFEPLAQISPQEEQLPV